MASEEQRYTPEFKTKVALDALEHEKKNLDRLSDKYSVPVSKILMWASQVENHGTDFFKQSGGDEPNETAAREEPIDVEVTDPEIADSIFKGVMADRLNYRRLTYWSILGMAIVIIFVLALMEMFEYNSQISKERVSSESEYYEVSRLADEAEKTLSSFGVVNLDDGIYRIPVDSAINELAVDVNE